MASRRFGLRTRGWIFHALALSVAVAAVLKGNNLLFATFSVLAGISAISAGMTLVGGRKLEISRIAPERAAAGEPFPVTLRIRNVNRWLPSGFLRLEDRLSGDGRTAALQPPPVRIPPLRPGEGVRAATGALAHQRGWARLGPLTVISEFPPGLFTCRTTLPVEDAVLILPRLGTLNRRLFSTGLARIEGADLAPVRSLPGNEEFAGLREYRPGDHLRRIHWKMSARLQGKLLVREFEDAQVRDAAILLETYLPRPDDHRRRLRLERAVTFAATLAKELLDENYRVRFRAFGPAPVTLRLEPRRGALDGLLEALALLKPSTEHPLADLLASEEPLSREVYFILRIGGEPLPPWDLLHRSLVLDAAAMRSLMRIPP